MSSDNDAALPPHQIRDESLKWLRKVRNGFFTPEALAALDTMSDTERAEAGLVLGNVGIMIRKLENVELAQIAGDLDALEPKFRKAINKLEQKLQNVKQLVQVVNAAASLVKMFASIPKLVGVPIPV